MLSMARSTFLRSATSSFFVRLEMSKVITMSKSYFYFHLLIETGPYVKIFLRLPRSRFPKLREFRRDLRLASHEVDEQVRARLGREPRHLTQEPREGARLNFHAVTHVYIVRKINVTLRVKPRTQFRDQAQRNLLGDTPETQEPRHARRAIYFAPGRPRRIKRHEEVPREEGAGDGPELRAAPLGGAHHWLKAHKTLAQ
jgi:hypothetical protein